MGLFHKRCRYKWRAKQKFANKGQYIDDYGYARFVGSNKLVHRYVAEKYVVRRKLLPNEEVHHRNRNKLDNRRSNLWVFNSQYEHNEIHRQDEIKYGKW